ncbi:MAG TPA: tRNA glutamyl-Q(34) synthetase GluQRS [Salinarimonas sp.]|jgi:glutamyl-Q tRNA(Asp) synthetase|nr:tRNA glutamyl-Q(34) synthetase GluQRS [Salinarimonas sp.]
MTRPALRFAPSPNGRLHLGHAYSALLNERLARALGGRLLLRLEDIDVIRCQPELAAAAEADLAWLGLAFDPPVRRQSRHFGEYRAALEGLRGRGLVYPCFCSRRDIAAAAATREAAEGRPWPRDPDGAPLYPGTCRGLDPAVAAARIASGEPHAWRLDLVAAMRAAPGPHGYVRLTPDGGRESVAAAPPRWGDVVLARKDIPTSYHLAVVHDDALQGITHVVRGRDLEAATDLHVLLQRLLRLPTPLYRHHDLVADEEGRKLAKSLGSRSLADLRASGVTAGEVRARLGFP